MNKTRLGLAATAVAVVSAVSVWGIGVASAEDAPSVQKLQADCNDGNGCVFTPIPSSLKTALGPQKQIGLAEWNCGSGNLDYTFNSTATRSSTTSLNSEFSAEATFMTIYKAAVKVSAGLSWTESDAVSNSNKVTLKAGEVAWMTYAPALSEMTGKIDLHYKDPVSGHRHWWVEPVVVKGPAVDGATGNFVAYQRAMTDEEKAKTCTQSQPGIGNLSIGDAAPSGLVETQDQIPVDGLSGTVVQGDANAQLSAPAPTPVAGGDDS